MDFIKFICNNILKYVENICPVVIFIVIHNLFLQIIYKEYKVIQFQILQTKRSLSFQIQDSNYSTRMIASLTPPLSPNPL